MSTQELVLTDEEFYDLFKALRAGIDRMPHLLGKRRNVLASMSDLFTNSPEEECEWVITMRVKRDLDAEIRQVQETALTDAEVDNRIKEVG